MGLIDDENFKRVLKRSLKEEEEEKQEKSEGSGGFKKMMEKILHSRTQIHIFHLQTKSYAEHIAVEL